MKLIPLSILLALSLATPTNLLAAAEPPSSAFSAMVDQLPSFYPVPTGVNNTSLVSGWVRLGAGSTLPALSRPLAQGPALEIGMLVHCQSGQWCKEHQLRWLDVKFNVFSVINNLALNFSLRGPSFKLGSRWRLHLLELELSHSPIWTDEQMNLSVQSIGMQMQFGVRTSLWVKGGCDITLSGIGFKSIHYHERAAPFYGIDMAKLEQGCQLAVGRSVQGWIGYRGIIKWQIGQSGDGTPNNTGPWGAMNSEASVTLEVGLSLPLDPNKFGLKAVQVVMPFLFDLKLNRGCISASADLFYACGNNSVALTGNLLLQVRLLW